MHKKRYRISLTYNDFLCKNKRKLKKYIKNRRKYINSLCLKDYIVYTKNKGKLLNKEDFLQVRGYIPRTNKNFQEVLIEEYYHIGNSYGEFLEWDIIY